MDKKFRRACAATGKSMRRLVRKAVKFPLNNILHICVAGLVAVFAFWLFWRVFVFVASIVVPPREIVLVPFEADKDDQKKLAPAIISAKLQDLQTRSKEAPTGYGFLNIPLLLSVPQQAIAMPVQTTGVLDKIELKIKDVDVPALIKAASAILAPARNELQGSITLLPTSSIVTARLVRGDKIIGSWQAIAKHPVAKDPTGDELEELLDQIVYQIIFDFMEKPKFKNWSAEAADTPSDGTAKENQGCGHAQQARIKPEETHPFGNWQSLRGYIGGLRALRAYQDNLNHDDLQAAIESFESLSRFAPDNPYGLYFFGLSLSEDRQEREAAVAFEQLQRLLDRQKEEAKWRQMRREAQLSEATVRLKFYKMPAAKRARDILTELIADLEKQQAPADAAYTEKLLVVAYTQLAHTHSTMLALLRGESRAKDDADVVSSITEVERNLGLAERKFAEPGKIWESERQKADVSMRMLNARGYGYYREAHFQANDDAEYQKHCREAIKKLEEANVARPNHYAVLQNLGMIYADEQYDPKGDSLDEAQGLFERTKKFVPRDYYQYEQLARIHWRRVDPLKTLDQAKPEIDAGRKEALEALKWDPNSGSALWTLALFARKTWEINDRKEGDDAVAALKAFANASESGKRSVKFENEYIAFLEELAHTRKNSAVGLNEITEYGIRFADNDEHKQRRSEVAKLGGSWVSQTLELTKAHDTKPELEAPYKRAQELQKEIERLSSEGVPP